MQEDDDSVPVEEDGQASMRTGIYSSISSSTLKQIKTIDLNGSFGTKIDTREFWRTAGTISSSNI